MRRRAGVASALDGAPRDRVGCRSGGHGPTANRSSRPSARGDCGGRGRRRGRVCHAITAGNALATSIVSSPQCGPARMPLSRQIRTFSTSDGIRYQSGFAPRGRRGHEPRPGGHGDGAAKSFAHDRRRLIEAEPHAGQQMRRVADEPGVGVVVGGAGLAAGRQLEARRARPRRGAAE